MYTYWHSDGKSKKKLPITITAGQDGVTEEHIIMLNDLDHEADLCDRYEQENRDYETENKKLKHFRNPEEGIEDPIEALITHKTDPYFLIDHAEDKPNPLIEQLLELMQKLTPKQVDFIYDHYGSLRQLTEIAAEDNVSPPAISNRKNKIINRLKKLFAEQGIF